MSRISRPSMYDFKKPKEKKSPKLIFVATEGCVTEPDYLGFFKNIKVHIIPIPCQENRSDTKDVLNNLIEYQTNPVNQKKYQFTDEDEFWLMVDVDHRNQGGHKQNFINALQDAYSRGYKLAVSNPAFEIWLYLHFSDLQEEDKGKSQSYFEEQISKMTDSIYNKSSLRREFFYPLTDAAMKRAENLDTNQIERWPQQTGTHVHRLVKSILGR